jgi:hypothetical protein
VRQIFVTLVTVLKTTVCGNLAQLLPINIHTVSVVRNINSKPVIMDASPSWSIGHNMTVNRATLLVQRILVCKCTKA